MEPIKRLEAIKKKLDKNGELIAERDAAIIAARESGHTWREIARILGMTEHGVIKAASRSRGE